MLLYYSNVALMLCPPPHTLRGHGDGMVGWGVCLHDGRGVDGTGAAEGAAEKLACEWWLRAAELHRHPQAAYELGVASYTGAGVPESEAAACALFRQAVDWSNATHPAALYMLGDCLLEGIGVRQRDGARALSLLKLSGDLGHRGARSRLLALLGAAPDLATVSAELEDEEDGGESLLDGRFTDASRQSFVRVAPGTATGAVTGAATGSTVTMSAMSPAFFDAPRDAPSLLPAQEELRQFEKAMDLGFLADIRRQRTQQQRGVGVEPAPAPALRLGK